MAGICRQGGCWRGEIGSAGDCAFGVGADVNFLVFGEEAIGGFFLKLRAILGFPAEERGREVVLELFLVGEGTGEVEAGYLEALDDGVGDAGSFDLSGVEV